MNRTCRESTVSTALHTGYEEASIWTGHTSSTHVQLVCTLTTRDGTSKITEIKNAAPNLLLLLLYHMLNLSCSPAPQLLPAAPFSSPSNNAAMHLEIFRYTTLQTSTAPSVFAETHYASYSIQLCSPDLHSGTTQWTESSSVFGCKRFPYISEHPVCAFVTGSTTLAIVTCGNANWSS